MSLHLIELKIKTALELVQNIDDLNDRGAGSSSAEFREWTRDRIRQNGSSLRGVLREIINRPKEEEDRG